ncbi:hypothetical protein BGZ70_002964 [Mortierella alpina]|uniref:AB hydrolase-1 domain-containing protein n=1 Tax=Mortierella alpina TaxID=64518 RepID=A0A9P6M568_MORAP|nr:hypothetical protein BGZ70_002964 [Mortierella alpina]
MHSIPTPQERTFQLRNGIVLAGKHWTTATSTAPARDSRRFLALHGHLDNAGSFDLLAPLMFQQLGPEPLEILALDLAGHGMSSHRQTEDYNLWRFVEDLDQVTEQLQWHKHALIGHSMGGAVCTLYAGLYESRVVLCILLDNLGPWARPVEDQPRHLLTHIEQKKNLAHKRMAFHPTIESACDARSKGGDFILHPDSAKVLVTRGLRPVEVPNPNDPNNNNTRLQGWTWSTDRILTIQPAQTLASGYARAFLCRITSPVLAVMASEDTL